MSWKRPTKQTHKMRQKSQLSSSPRALNLGALRAVFLIVCLSNERGRISSHFHVYTEAFAPPRFSRHHALLQQFGSDTERLAARSLPIDTRTRPVHHAPPTIWRRTCATQLRMVQASYGSRNNQNYYQLLGVPRQATNQEIKSAYRKLAKQYHPDVNPGQDTTSLFQEINRAYETLSDPEKRRNYNMYGSSESLAEAAAPDNPFARGQGFGADVEDVYTSFFGRSKVGSRTKHKSNNNNNHSPGGWVTDETNVKGGNPGSFRRGPTIGADVQMDLEIDFQTAIAGGQHTIEIDQLQTCKTCSGSGEGHSVITCPVCNGSGSTADDDATIWQRQEQTCYNCHGKGKIQLDYCADCEGRGTKQTTKRIKINIPAGVEDGSRILVCGEGSAGPYGGPQGDLYLFFRIQQDERFRRQGCDIHAVETISCVDAMLGMTLNAATVDGEVPIIIQPGAQPGQVLRIKGKGAPRSMSQPGARGDHFVTIKIEIPTELSDDQHNMIRQWQMGNGGGAGAGPKTPGTTAVNAKAADNLHKAQLEAEREAREEAEEQYRRIQVELTAQKAEAERLMKAWKDESRAFSKLLEDARIELATNHDDSEKNFSKLLQQIADLEETNKNLAAQVTSNKDALVGRDIYESEVNRRAKAEQEVVHLRKKLMEMEQQTRSLQESLQATEQALTTKLQAAVSDQQKVWMSRETEKSMDGEKFASLKRDFDALESKYSALTTERDSLASAIANLEDKLSAAKEGLQTHVANEDTAKQATRILQQEVNDLRQRSEVDSSALESERTARLNSEQEVEKLQKELISLLEKQAKTTAEMTAMEAEREQRLAVEAELTQLKQEMESLLAQKQKTTEEMSKMELGWNNRIAVEQEMSTLQTEMESLLLEQAQALEHEIEEAKTEAKSASERERIRRQHQQHKTQHSQEPNPTFTTEIWEMTDEDVKEVEKLKFALKSALKELETTRSVLRDAVDRVDASDLRSGKLEQELMTLKADLQLVSTRMEEMRATSHFTSNASPFTQNYSNGHSTTNGHGTNGNSDPRRRNGGWQPFDW
mmetsp:Transcript_11041/g.30511  ORF Transcript_11041/g.30511 Transcript_11041/m.30511 type:complete len:1047 (+) Transcript_11041:224-3364(+)